MKIVIVGCGKVGKTILERIVSEKHEVVAVDNDMHVIERITNEYDVIGLCGNGTEFEQLKDAGVASCDLFIAATGSDELNMLSCFAAKKLGAKHTVARIRDRANNTSSLAIMKESLELSMAINPEQLSAKAIYNILRLPSASKVESFGMHSFEMFEITLKDIDENGMSIADLRRSAKSKFLVCAVERGGDVYIPKGNFVLNSGDKVGVISYEADTRKILDALGENSKKVRKVIIMGASTIGYYLASILCKNGYEVKVIEKDASKCEKFLEEMNGNVTVIEGDGMSQELLLEEGINDTDAFVALTGNDEANILMSVYTKNEEVSKIVTKVNKEQLISIAHGLNLDCIITPRKIIADKIVRYARALQNSMGSKIEALYTLMNGKAEAVEFVVSDDFKYAGIALKDLKMKSDVLIAGIIRQKQAIIPDGNEMIMPHDRVVIISSQTKIYDLLDIIG